MILKEVFIQAIQSLIGHRIRAVMTMTGIAWGIVAVVLLMAYGNGFHTAIAVGFHRAFSDGTVVIWNGQTSMQAGGERAGRRIRLKEEDVEALRQLGTIKYVSPEYVEGLPMAYGIKQTSSNVRGVAPEYGEMRAEVAEFGRFLNAEDVEKQRRVVFLGSEVAKKLFGNAPAVGETIRISGLSFEVIGVLTQKVSFSNYYSPDKYCAFIPYTTVKQLWSQDYVDNLVFQTISPATHFQALKQVREVLGARHNFNPNDKRAITFNDSVENMKMISGMTGGLKIILSFIGALTLMIGGIGVMNIMLVSVTERTREIGVRKALGARRRHILIQFLLEALVITFLGGVLGVALSWLAVTFVGHRPFLADLLEDPTKQTDIFLLLSGDVILTATGILMIVGIFSGLWPALRASKTDPIESLRYE
ncbi:MAG TPA: ABC transporter permease [Blastocatellia bacterium]|nr:ABC transporter permease [Blastocatellia bacterium]HMV83583.1 ABC transporter permease [Blastocatellia bacterium]HMX29073.1 ABC transporter permease [Blastocatellia bacterium]HMZ19135.1 ABC transporter permease [Blastocatellia bacterium]HNG28444.1 ABC transporter permease [Blastocatellia bacterium]